MNERSCSNMRGMLQTIKKPENLLRFTAYRVLWKKCRIKMPKYFDNSEYQIRPIDKINELDPKFKKLAKETYSGSSSALKMF